MTSASAPTTVIEEDEEKKAKRRLWDIQPSRVDVVDSAANKQTWLVCKSEGSMSDSAVRTEESVLDQLTSIRQELLGMRADLKTASVQKEADQMPKNESGIVLREVAERAISLAALVVEGSDNAKITAEIAAILNILMDLAEQYPKAGEDDAYPAPDKYPSVVSGKIEKAEAPSLIKEIGEKALALANQLDSDTPPATEELAAAIAWMAKALEALTDKYPEVEVEEACASAEDKEKEEDVKKAADVTQDASPVDTENTQTAAEGMDAVLANSQPQYDYAAILRKTAQTCYVAASAISQNGVQVDALTSIGTLYDETQEAWTALALQKAEEANTDLQKGIVAFLRTIVAKAGALAAVWGSDCCPEQQQADINYIHTGLVNLIPDTTEEAAKTFTSAISDLILKATSLENDAVQLSVEEPQLKAVKDQLSSLAEKYVGVKKAAAFDANDLGSIFQANKLLEQLDTGFKKLGFVAKDSQPQQVPEVMQVAPNVLDAIANLANKVDQIANAVQSVIVHKAVDMIPGPAAAGLPTSVNTPSDNNFPACPDNYNDPAYRALLKARGFNL